MRMWGWTRRASIASMATQGSLTSSKWTLIEVKIEILGVGFGIYNNPNFWYPLQMAMLILEMLKFMQSVVC